MDDNLTILLVMALAVNAAVVLFVLTTWIRGRQRLAGAKTLAEANGTVAALTEENEQLKGQVSHLEKRMIVLERIATDPAERTAREIENLR